ncbi:hypothetical protein BH10ACT7_BH10ACT7_13630 [soil metagenome]
MSVVLHPVPQNVAVSSPLALVRLFGRVAVQVDGVPIPLRGSIPAAIVTRLALSAGEQVPLEEFVDDLWESPPPAAVGNLRANISRLRSAGLAPALVGGRGGYTLAPHVQVDVLEFREAATAAIASRDRHQLEYAEALWTGDPFRGVDAPFAEARRADLIELRRRLTQALAELRLESGHLDELLVSLPDLVRAHPTHEEPTRLLATALARAGRTTDALEAIDAFVRRLAEEQGLDPSPALAELRMSIVRQDPVVVPRSGAGRARQHGVPLPITRFVGRRRELELVAAARQESRLVTLTGPGGVGKTRLAVESLRDAPTVDTVQWLLELAPLSSGRELVVALAELLGASTPTVPAFAEQLSGHGTLLVLDNAEHLLGEVAELVSGLLAASPGLSILVTSREPLRIPGERLIPVSTMLDHDAADAVALFTQRAADALPGFTVDADVETRNRVRHLARLLDGLPLALELTAARLDVMDLGELVRSLESEELLTLGGSGDGRHASLANMIRWSARLLRPEELELLAQLGNFAGGVSLDAIAGICQLDGADVRQVAAVLAQKSLLAVVGDAARGRRYRMLESVKLYARQLPVCDDRGDWRVRHSRWYADRVDELEPGIRSKESAMVHAEFDLDRAELLVAVTSAIERGDRDVAVRLAGGMAWHRFIRGAMAEGKQWIDRALALPGETDPYFEARAYRGAIMLIYRSGDKFAGEAYAKAGLPLARKAGDPTLLALFLACNGMWAAEDDPVTGWKLMAEADAIMERGIEPWAVSEVLIFRSICFDYAKKPAAVMRELQAAIDSALAAHNVWAAGSASWRLANTLIMQKRDRDALEELMACFEILEPQGDVLGVILSLHSAAVAVSGVERQRDGAALFAAVDRLGALYGFPRISVNDDGYERWRTRTKQALTTAEWNAEYRRGTRLDLAEAVALVGSVVASLPPRRA